MNVGFIGAGNMAGAIIDAIMSSDILAPSQIHIFDTSNEKLSSYKQRGMNVYESNIEMIQNCDMVFLGIKPQMLGAVAQEVKGLLNGKCIISILAGVTVSKLRESLGEGIYVIRVLPNTPMLVLKGATVVAKPEHVPEPYIELVLKIFGAAGDVEMMDEDKINSVIPVSSSSPAFFFRMIRAMAQAGEAAGIDFDVAYKLALSTMHGACHIMMESGKSPDELIAQVTSKGGTTLAALTAFDEFHFETLMNTAFTRCITRADELGRS